MPDVLPTDHISEVSKEFAPGLDDLSFVQNLVAGVKQKRDKLDLIIGKAAPDWPIEQIAIVDRNILRLGLYELLFGDKRQVPARVAINESIELAKTFGGENSGRFVNGVLGAVYKELGEPDKRDIPRKKKIKDIPYEEMPIEKLGGAIVYRLDKPEIELALVHDIFGYWTLSKGHIEAGESVEDGIKREIKEELSLDIALKDKLGQNEYIAADPEKGKIRKQVEYFLAEAGQPNKLALGDKAGLTEAAWYPVSAVPDLDMYDDIVPIITTALKLLAERRRQN